MKIGIFDSGLGGLIVARAIRKKMPEYDYVYYGDTKRVPYGNKSHEAVFEFTKEAIDHLFRDENCALVIVACNTASARALRQIQQEYLPARNASPARNDSRSDSGRHNEAGGPKNFPDRRVLGVLIPAAEAAARFDRIGILATLGTVASDTFPTEIKKLNRKVKIFQNAAPVLVPVIEEGDNKMAEPFIRKYLKPFASKKLDTLVLGCTHYPILKKEIKKEIEKISRKKVKIISQDEIIPAKLREYLARHPEIESKLSRKRTVKIRVTDETQNMNRLVKKWFGGIMKK